MSEEILHEICVDPECCKDVLVLGVTGEWSCRCGLNNVKPDRKEGFIADLQTALQKAETERDNWKAQLDLGWQKSVEKSIAQVWEQKERAEKAEAERDELKEERKTLGGKSYRESWLDCIEEIANQYERAEEAERKLELLQPQWSDDAPEEGMYNEVWKCFACDEMAPCTWICTTTNEGIGVTEEMDPRFRRKICPARETGVDKPTWVRLPNVILPPQTGDKR